MHSNVSARGRLALVAALLPAILLAGAGRVAAQGTLLFPTKGVSDKPQSKLWVHDGFWWACLDNATKLTIYKLQAGLWVPKLDLQNAIVPVLKGGTADVLWDGTHLFVAAYDPTTSKIYKLAYDAANQTYVPLAGFPVSIAMRPGSETIVLEKDSTNRLYLTYEAESKIYVQWSTSGDHKTWSSTPLSIAAPVDPDDISTIVAFGGNAIGVLWSDQRGQQVQFRKHRDTDPANVWQPVETVRSGFGCIDDHLNMKADSQGRVYFVAKDFFDAVWVGRRDTNGTWTVTTGASGLDCGTRPILQIDEASNKLYVFYTRWEACVSSGAHAIEERVAYLDNLLFSLPTVVIAKSGVTMNEVQGTKQRLPAGSLAIVCEGNGSIYWRGWGSTSGIGGSDPGGLFPPPPAPPGNPTANVVTESPTTRVALWRFENGTGTQATDASGNNHTLTLGPGLAAPHWTSGVTGGGLFFDGANYATAPSAGFSFLGQSFTLESWMKVDLTNAPGTGVIFARGDSLQEHFTLNLTDETLRFEWSVSDTAGVSVKTTATLRDNAWHHIAAVYDVSLGEGRLYVDGIKKVAKVMPGPVMDKSTWLLDVGALVSGTVVDKSFAGSLDLMAIANSALYSGDFVPPFLYPTTATKYVRLTWSPSSSPAGVLGYRIGRAVNGGTSVDLVTPPTPNRWLADLGPPDGFLAYTLRTVDGLTQAGPGVTVQTSWESNPPVTPSAPQALAWSASTATVEGPAFWELEDGQGSGATDGTGLGHALVLGAAAAADNAEPVWAVGFSGKCLNFDGSNDYAQVADAADLRFTDSYTIEAWVRRTKLNSTQAILNKDAGSSKRNYGMTILSNGTVEFSWSKTSGSARKTTSTVSISDMEWHHVACVYDKSAETNTIYIDGGAAGSGSATGTVYTGSEPVLLGARGTSSLSDFFKGDLDLVRISKGKRYSAPFVPPTFLHGGAQRHVVVLSWKLPATGLVKTYNLYRQPLPSGTNTLLANIGVGTPAFTDVTAVQGAAYRYTVKARNSANVEGPASAPIDVTVPLPTDVAHDAPPVAPGPRLRLEPNPFNPQATVSFRLESDGPVELDLYDASGRRLDTVVRGVFAAGVHRVRLLRPGSGLHLASGVYFLRLQADGRVTRLKAVLVR